MAVVKTEAEVDSVGLAVASEAGTAEAGRVAVGTKAVTTGEMEAGEGVQVAPRGEVANTEGRAAKVDFRVPEVGSEAVVPLHVECIHRSLV